VGEVTAGEISSATKNIGSHLDVLSLEYMERAQPENLFEGTTRKLTQVLGLIKEELGLFNTATGKLELPP